MLFVVGYDRVQKDDKKLVKHYFIGPEFPGVANFDAEGKIPKNVLVLTNKCQLDVAIKQLQQWRDEYGGDDDLFTRTVFIEEIGDV